FKEFAPYIEKCKFHDCSHTGEIGCGVLAAVKDGHIASSRHDSYKALYERQKDIKEWERRK
ncbi:MAG: ribosome small subunit-dependent GTPase A, partial [Oscillospiraceae bacterium]